MDIIPLYSVLYERSPHPSFERMDLRDDGRLVVMAYRMLGGGVSADLFYQLVSTLWILRFSLHVLKPPNSILKGGDCKLNLVYTSAEEDVEAPGIMKMECPTTDEVMISYEVEVSYALVMALKEQSLFLEQNPNSLLSVRSIF